MSGDGGDVFLRFLHFSQIERETLIHEKSSSILKSLKKVLEQLFPSFSAASAATGYTTEQLEQLGTKPNFSAEPAVKEQD